MVEDSSLFNLTDQEQDIIFSSSNGSHDDRNNEEAKETNLSASNNPVSTDLILGHDSPDLIETDSIQSDLESEDSDEDSIDEAAVIQTTPSHDQRELISDTRPLPYSAQVRIVITCNGVETLGSATMISSKHALTSASHLYSHQTKRESDQIVVILPFSSSERPHRYIHVKRFFYPEEYIYVKSDDYGLLELEEDIGHITGFLHIRIHTTDEIDNKLCSIYGYPALINRQENTQLYGMDTRVFKVEDKDLLRYQIHSSLGQIGSSIYYYSPEENKYFTIGVHARGNNGLGYNLGTFLNFKRIDQIQRWQDSRGLHTMHNLSCLPAELYEVKGYLRDLRDYMKVNQEFGVISLSGVAGVGKSTIALKFATDAIGSYHYIWWLDREKVDSSLTALSEILNIQATSYQDILDGLRDYISSTTSRFLFIFDGLEDKNIILSFLPTRGHFIITTRLQIPEFVKIKVSSLSCEASVQLLSSKLSNIPAENLIYLANFLEGLHLALIQAAFDIPTYRIQVRQYIQEFSKIMARNDKYKNIVRSDIESLSEEAKYILKIVCLGDCNNIPYDMLYSIYSHTYTYTDFNSRLEEIIGLNILSYNTQREVCKIYRVIHHASILQLSSSINDELIQHYSNYLYNSYNPNQAAEDIKIENLTPHVVMFLNHYITNIQPSRAVLLYSRVAIAYKYSFLDRNTFYKYIELTESYLKAITTEDSDIAVVYNTLGECYYSMKEYAKSAEYYFKCLKIREATLSEDHPDIAKLYDNLGGLYYYMKEYSRSEEHYSKCIELREAAQYEDMKDLARIYNCLGGLNCRLENYERSEEYYAKCLSIVDTQNHSDIAEIYKKLGDLYNAKGDYASSEESYKECLSIMETNLPPNSPNLVYIRSCLEAVRKAMRSMT